MTKIHILITSAIFFILLGCSRTNPRSNQAQSNLTLSNSETSSNVNVSSSNPSATSSNVTPTGTSCFISDRPTLKTIGNVSVIYVGSSVFWLLDLPISCKGSFKLIYEGKEITFSGSTTFSKLYSVSGVLNEEYHIKPVIPFATGPNEVVIKVPVQIQPKVNLQCQLESAPESVNVKLNSSGQVLLGATSTFSVKCNTPAKMISLQSLPSVVSNDTVFPTSASLSHQVKVMVQTGSSITVRMIFSDPLTPGMSVAVDALIPVKQV